MDDHEICYDIIAATGEVFSDLNFGMIEMLSQMVPIKKIIKTENYKMGGFTFVKTSVHKTLEELTNENNRAN
jgi:hypothetical protein